MDSAAVLLDGFERVRGAVHTVLHRISADDLTARLDEKANSIAWLVWHLTRVQDDHVADAAGLEQVWLAQGWAEEFDLPLSDVDTGYGHHAEDVASVRVGSPRPLRGYHDAVHEQTAAFVRDLDADALDRIVDEGWDPPVTLGVRLVSVLADDLQHVGQAEFVRGVLRRR